MKHNDYAIERRFTLTVNDHAVIEAKGYYINPKSEPQYWSEIWKRVAKQ